MLDSNLHHSVTLSLWCLTRVCSPSRSSCEENLCPKMVSVETFRVLGYVYGILGIAGSTFEMTKCFLRIAIGHIEHHQRHFNSEHFRQAQDVSTVFALPLCALWMVFFVILILGIKQVICVKTGKLIEKVNSFVFQKNLILVRAHKMFLIISNAIGFIILGIGILVLTIFYNEKDAKLARVILVIVLVIGLGILTLL